MPILQKVRKGMEGAGDWLVKLYTQGLPDVDLPEVSIPESIKKFPEIFQRVLTKIYTQKATSGLVNKPEVKFYETASKIINSINTARALNLVSRKEQLRYGDQIKKVLDYVRQKGNWQQGLRALSNIHAHFMSGLTSKEDFAIDTGQEITRRSKGPLFSSKGKVESILAEAPKLDTSGLTSKATGVHGVAKTDIGEINPSISLETVADRAKKLQELKKRYAKAKKQNKPYIDIFLDELWKELKNRGEKLYSGARSTLSKLYTNLGKTPRTRMLTAGGIGMGVLATALLLSKLERDREKKKKNK